MTEEMEKTEKTETVVVPLVIGGPNRRKTRDNHLYWTIGEYFREEMRNRDRRAI